MAEISAKLLISKADQSFQTFIRAKVKYSLMSQSGTAADPQETESLQNIFLFLSLFGFCGSIVTAVLISHPWSILAHDWFVSNSFACLLGAFAKF